MKKWQRMKSGLLAVVCGVSMVMAIPVCAEEQMAFAECVKTAELLDPCSCGAELTYIRSIEISCTLIDSGCHELVVDQYYRCKYGHVQCIKVITTEAHSRNRYEDKGHRTYPDELFGEHTYKLMCKCGKEYETVAIICHYPGMGSHETPY